jgi:glycosyltransferase involved in cell wall biosynthesis
VSEDQRFASDVEIVIVEPDPRGHRLQYVRHLALAVGDHRWAWISSKAGMESAERQAYLGDLRPLLVSTASGSRRMRLKNAIELARCVGARRVIVPDGDKYLMALLSLSHTWSRSSPDLSVLLMRTTWPSGMGLGAWRLRAKCLAAWATNRLPNVRLRFLTDGFGVARSRKGYRRILPVPEPIDLTPATSEGSSQLLSLPTDHLTIGILGEVGLRKNPSVLIEAAATLQEVVVVLAGRFSPEAKALAAGDQSWLELRRARRLVELDDRVMTSEEFDGLLRQLTAVATLHDNDAPSGILCEAVARGKPAIVASGGWLEQIVTALGFGITTEVTTEGVRATLKSFGSYRTDLESNAARAACRLGTDAFVNALLH